MESKLFLGAGTDSSSFEKAKTVFCISLQKIPVLGHVLGTANGPALPSAWSWTAIFKSLNLC